MYIDILYSHTYNIFVTNKIWKVANISTSDVLTSTYSEA